MLASLVVGLGGTGSWVVAHLKERLVDDARWRLLDGEITPELFYRPTLRFLKV